MFLMQMAREREMLHWTLEENGGEMTEEAISQEEKIDKLAEIFESEGGIDAVGRFVKYGEDKINARKAEKEYAERHMKAEEKEQERFLGLIDAALKKAQTDKVKGSFGYSFTQHTSTTCKPDNKMIKDLFYEKAEQVLRESGAIPNDVTFSLSASVSRLPEGALKPHWYNTTSVGKATFRKPRKPDEDFKYNEFE